MADNPMKEAMARWGAMDERRQQQIARQVEIINRLTADEDPGVVKAMEFLNGSIARAEEFIQQHGLWDDYRREVIDAVEDGPTAATD